MQSIDSLHTVDSAQVPTQDIEPAVATTPSVKADTSLSKASIYDSVNVDSVIFNELVSDTAKTPTSHIEVAVATTPSVEAESAARKLWNSLLDITD